MCPNASHPSRQQKGLLLHRGSADHVPAVINQQEQRDQVWVLLQRGPRLGVTVWAVPSAWNHTVQEDVPTWTRLYHRWQRCEATYTKHKKSAFTTIFSRGCVLTYVYDCMSAFKIFLFFQISMSARCCQICAVTVSASTLLDLSAATVTWDTKLTSLPPPVLVGFIFVSHTVG